MIEDLPAYQYCSHPDCNDKHFLMLNKDIQGHWTIGYVAFKPERGILTENGFDSIEDAAKWMSGELADD